MKKALLVLSTLLSIRSFGTHVTFCTDMRNTPMDPGGIHLYIEGDTFLYPMLQDPNDTNIYCVTLDLPADSCIEYDFVNGSGFYGLEFVPVESRVDDVNSDRWVCTHSNSNDTVHTHPILFGGNAPDGNLLVRPKVNFSQGPAVDPNGVFVAGTFNAWNTTTDRMSNLYHGSVYEALCYVSQGTYEYRFYNGLSAETVPAVCSVNSNREVVVNIDTVVPDVCFSQCNTCQGVGVFTVDTKEVFSVYPNPAANQFTVRTENAQPVVAEIIDDSGRSIQKLRLSQTGIDTFDRNGVASGNYQLVFKDKNNKVVGTARIVFQ